MDISFDSLCELPQDLRKNLPALTTLIAINNKLADVPRDLAYLPYLDVTNNPLFNIPGEFRYDMKKVCVFGVWVLLYYVLFFTWVPASKFSVVVC